MRVGSELSLVLHRDRNNKILEKAKPNSWNED